MKDDAPCGPQWWPYRVRKWISPDWACPCCEDHDLGNTSEGNRKANDFEFRKCLKRNAWAAGSSEGHVNRELRAGLAGWSVTFLGWAFKKPRQWFWEKM